MRRVKNDGLFFLGGHIYYTNISEMLEGEKLMLDSNRILETIPGPKLRSSLPDDHKYPQAPKAVGRPAT
jgi:hypothetical protein